MIPDIDNFINSIGGSRSTLEGYRYILLRLSKWIDTNPIDLPPTATYILSFIYAQNWGNALSVKSLSVIKSYINFTYNIILSVRIKKEESPPQRTLSRQQCLALLTSIDLSTPKGKRDIAIITLALDTGLRNSEICNAQLEKTNLSGLYLSAKVKGGKWRFAHFSEITRSYLDTWIEARSQIADTKNLFCSIGGNTPGKPITPRGLGTIFKHLAETANLTDGLSPHDLRRTMACIGTELGAPSRVIQLAGGWSDIKLVERYTKALNSNIFSTTYSPITALIPSTKPP